MPIQECNKLDKNDYNMIKIIMSIRLLLGSYSKLYKSFAFTVIAKTYCTVFAIVLTYFCKYEWVTASKYGTFILFILKVLSFNLVQAVALLSDGESFFGYLDETERVDPLGLVKIAKHRVLFCFPIFIGVVALDLYRFALILRLSNSFTNITLAAVDTVMIMALHLNHMTRIMIFEILWVRVKSLRIVMDNFASTSNIVSERQVNLLTMKLVEYLLIYKRLLQTVKNIGNASKFLMLIALPMCLIALLSTVDVLSRNILSHMNCIIAVTTFLNITLPCLPAVFGELCSAEADKIKSTLIRRYRVCSNDVLRNKFSDGIKFLEISPMNFTVWRIFPIRLSLLLSIFSVFSTYTIVLLQFNQIQY